MVTVNQQDPETETAKWHSAIVTYYFHLCFSFACLLTVLVVCWFWSNPYCTSCPDILPNMVMSQLMFVDIQDRPPTTILTTGYLSRNCTKYPLGTP